MRFGGRESGGRHSRGREAGGMKLYSKTTLGSGGVHVCQERTSVMCRLVTSRASKDSFFNKKEKTVVTPHIRHNGCKIQACIDQRCRLAERLHCSWHAFPAHFALLKQPLLRFAHQTPAEIRHMFNKPHRRNRRYLVSNVHSSLKSHSHFAYDG